MVFSSIFNLMQNYHEDVYKFLCRIFYENYTDLSLEDCQVIYSAVLKFKETENKNFENFIKLFDGNNKMYDVLKELGSGGNYEIFANESDVFFNDLEGIIPALVSDYIDIFSYRHVLKPDAEFIGNYYRVGY